jgi:hypothetical protein
MYFTKPFNKNLKSGKGFSEVNGIRFQTEFSDINNYCRQNKLTLFDRVKLKLKSVLIYVITDLKVKKAIWFKEKVYLGPFVGEFGNFLGHTLPLIGYLSKNGVEVHFCGLELFRPFCVDDNGIETVIFYPLRDIFMETTMGTNFGAMPADVQQEINLFYEEAATRGVLIDLRDNFFYWFVFRDFVAKGSAFFYAIKENNITPFESNTRSCVLFPRSKGAKESKNNGQEWDYDEVITSLVDSFDKIYVLGHPAFVKNVRPHPKVELKFSNDNKELVKICSNADCIISQHSGVIYLSTLFQVPYVLLYKGGSVPSEIGSLNNTLYYLNSVKKPYQIEFCYDLKNLNPIIASILKNKK